MPIVGYNADDAELADKVYTNIHVQYINNNNFLLFSFDSLSPSIHTLTE